MPTLAIMVGVPLSGKSTAIKTHPFSLFLGTSAITLPTVVASSDDHIEKIAKTLNMTYNDVFKDVIKLSTRAMYNDIDNAIDNGYNVIWDQTNLDRKTRKSKIERFPDEYKKFAFYFAPPSIQVFKARNQIRYDISGKNIPLDVFTGMVKRLEKPTLDEGFDRIIEMD